MSTVDIRGKVLERVTYWARAEAKAEPIPETARLSDILSDEFDKLELAMDIEEDLGITIGDETIDGWATVADVIASVETITGA